MDIEHDNQAPLILKSGDAIRLRALSPKGEALLQQEGELWTVLRVEASTLALNFDAGLLIKAAKHGAKKWLAFSDPHVYVELCKD